jgi:hypothetical protein
MRGLLGLKRGLLGLKREEVTGIGDNCITNSSSSSSMQQRPS